MKKVLLGLLLTFMITPSVKAVVDPFGVPNNKVGVHILEPGEIGQASKLVNSNGGDWGYVTIPMRSNDRDREKWTVFFNLARTMHVIPIIRLATYPVADVWETPNVYDLVDFANFLNDMPWPTKNRYVILFNEPNHANEWGGQVRPDEYATLLADAKIIFKSRSPDFFLLSAGLDMSVPNSSTSVEALRFYQLMQVKQPDWYQFVDGLSVHAYPNPAFSASVYSTTRFGVVSYRYELAALQRFGHVGKPIFITETGTILTNDFYNITFSKIWTDPQIVAVTPFILFAGQGDFVKFSLLDSNHQPKKSYREILELNKIIGSPLLGNSILARSPIYSSPEQNSGPQIIKSITSFVDKIINFKTKTKLISIAGNQLEVEMANNELTRMRGLSGRQTMPKDRGMLFEFSKPDTHQFWMQDMHFALDFIWIRSNKIVEINPNILPPNLTNNISVVIIPKQPIDSVLEVNAGFAASHNLQVGDYVNIGL